MENKSYSTINRQIYLQLTKGLSLKAINILNRRFGIESGKPETLEAIGKDLGVTRERIRQIQEAAFSLVKKNNSALLAKVLLEIKSYFVKNGGFKKEDIALKELGGENNKPYVLFLLNLNQENFSRVCGEQDHYHFWQLGKSSSGAVVEKLKSIVLDLESNKKLLTKEEITDSLSAKYNLENQAILSYFEISKRIGQNEEGKFGLVSWPEIKPKGVKDKAFLVLKKHQNPLHFRKIADLIGELDLGRDSKSAHPQTVHNELIKDPRFVLVGRGTYALGEWGYKRGAIKDVIAKILEKKQSGALKDEIIKEVLSQRLVAKNTVLINLNDKNLFKKDSGGRYTLNNA